MAIEIDWICHSCGTRGRMYYIPAPGADIIAPDYVDCPLCGKSVFIISVCCGSEMPGEPNHHG